MRREGGGRKGGDRGKLGRPDNSKRGNCRGSATVSGAGTSLKRRKVNQKNTASRKEKHDF